MFDNGYRVRRDIASNWNTVDPVLADGELGYEKDTHMLKIGDGSTSWLSLPYVVLFDTVDSGSTIGLIFNVAANSGYLSLVSVGGM